jgi:hypothetical protein
MSGYTRSLPDVNRCRPDASLRHVPPVVLDTQHLMLLVHDSATQAASAAKKK